MKIYQIQYQQTEVYTVFPCNNYLGGGFYNPKPAAYVYGLVDKTEVVKTNDIKKEIERIKKKALGFKSPGIFPNMKAEFVLKNIKIL